LSTQLSELFDTPYYHAVFTVPNTLNVLVPGNEREFYGALMKAAWESLRKLCRRDLGGDPGAVAVLHTWGQNLWLHPHVHMVVTGGALSSDMLHWRSCGESFLVDVKELSAAFRDRFCALLGKKALSVEGSAEKAAELLAEEGGRDWVVFIKPPVSDCARVFEYLSRYTHRVCMANGRIEAIDDSGRVTFSVKDYRAAEGDEPPPVGTMTLDAPELIGRFLRHVLPRGFRSRATRDGPTQRGRQ
jgi:hypothetical protein